MLKWLIGAVVVYCAFVTLLYLAQRSLQYFPERRRTTPAAAGLPEAEELVLDTADGEHVIVWHVPPRKLLFFSIFTATVDRCAGGRAHCRRQRACSS
jgi:hypothetical protein